MNYILIEVQCKHNNEKITYRVSGHFNVLLLFFALFSIMCYEIRMKGMFNVNKRRK